jgi:hypothetical protein
MKNSFFTRLFKDRKNTAPIGRKQRAKNVALKVLTAVLVVMLGLNAYIFLTDTTLIGGAKISTTGIHSWFDSLMADDTNKPSTISTPELPEKTDTETIYIPEVPIAPEVLEQSLAEVTVNELNDDSLYVSSTLNIAEAFAYTTKSAPNFGNYTFNQDGSLIEPEIVEVPQLEVEESEVIFPETKSEVVVAKNNNSTLSFHVIGGVFCNEANARKYYNMLKSKGFDAQLLLNKKINCNRVSYRKLNNRDEALRLMDSIKSTENPDAWVLIVKE